MNHLQTVKVCTFQEPTNNYATSSNLAYGFSKAHTRSLKNLKLFAEVISEYLEYVILG